MIEYYLKNLKMELIEKYGIKMPKNLKVADLLNHRPIDEISISMDDYNKIQREGIYLVDRIHITMKERNVTTLFKTGKDEDEALKIYYSYFLRLYLLHKAPDAIFGKPISQDL